jgi:hypothetical protein
MSAIQPFARYRRDDVLTKWNAAWDPATIRIFKSNGAWTARDEKSRERLARCGLDPAGNFLSYEHLLCHVSSFGFCLETSA